MTIFFIYFFISINLALNIQNTKWSKIVLIIHLSLLHFSFHWDLYISMILLFRVKSISIFSCNILWWKDRMWLPSCPIKICMVLSISAFQILLFSSNWLSISVHWIWNFLGMNVCYLVRCFPLFLNLNIDLHSSVDETSGELFFHIYLKKLVLIYQ